MKLILFKTNKSERKGRKRKGIGMDIERILFFTFLISFVLLIVVQTLHVSPSITTFLSSRSDFEGKPLGLEEYLYNHGEIGLELIDSEANNNLKVLVNGEQVAVFDTNTINIPVIEGDVVEIDGSSCEKEAQVEIISKSDNIDDGCIGRRVVTQFDIKTLVKIKVK